MKNANLAERILQLSLLVTNLFVFGCLYTISYDITIFRFFKNLKSCRFFKVLSLLLLFSSAIALTLTAKSGSWKRANPRYWVTKEEFRVAKPAGSVGKIAICMLYTSGIEEFAKLSVDINSCYAKKHGYDFVCFDRQFSNRDPTWDKLIAVKKCLNEKINGKYLYDHVMWIDADAYFNDQKMTLETFVHPQKDLIICDGGWGNVANAGVFLISNTAWSREFIDSWYRLGESSSFMHNLYHEQTVLEGMFFYDMMGLKSRILILEPDVFNSKPYTVCSLRKGWDETFVVHLMAMPYKKRAEIMSNYIKKRNLKEA